jgi:hypothetical protein
MFGVWYPAQSYPAEAPLVSVVPVSLTAIRYGSTLFLTPSREDLQTLRSSQPLFSERSSVQAERRVIFLGDIDEVQ